MVVTCIRDCDLLNIIDEMKSITAVWQLPVANSLSGSQTYPTPLLDSGGNDNTRAFNVQGLKVVTSGAKSGTVIIPITTTFSQNPGTTTVSSISQTGQGSAITINTISTTVSGTGSTRLITLVVKFTTSAASTATTGDLGTFTVNLNVGTAGATLNVPTTPPVGPQLKLNISGNDSGMNCKVNYPSLMSYSRQFLTYLGANYVLDFSHLDINPDIDESVALAESGFFSNGAGLKLVSAYDAGGSRAYKVNTAPDIDWNGNNGIGGSSIQDPNNFGITGCQASVDKVERGFDDWKNIQLDFKEGIGSFDGVYPDARQLEITGDIIEQAEQQVDEGTATTTASPPGGSYVAAQLVTLESDESAMIYYTTDGTDPTTSSTSGTSPISIIISDDTTLKFFSTSSATGNPEVIRFEDYDIANPGEITLLGFYAPVDNPPTVNTIKAGKTTTLKFEVFADGVEITDPSVVESVKQFKVSCDPEAPSDPIEQTIASPGSTVLRYDSNVGQFVYNWKSPNAKGCYDVVLTLDDGSKLTARFRTT